MSRISCRLFAFALVGCTGTNHGEGIGRRPYAPTAPPVVEPLNLLEVFVATPDPLARFVEIENPGDASVALGSLFLTDGHVTQALSGTLAPAEARDVVLDAALVLPRNAGDIAVVDGDGIVHAYLAWGGDPSLANSGLAVRAASAGVYQPGDFVSVGFPVPDGIAVVRTEAGEGCALATPSAPAAAPDATTCPIERQAPSLSEVFPAATAGGVSWLELENTTSAALALDGVRVCQPPQCHVLGRFDIAAGAKALLQFGPIAPPMPADVAFVSAAPLFLAGDIALVAPGATELNQPERFLGFLRYGSGQDTSLGATAVVAGLWPAVDVRVAAPQAGESLSHTNGGGPTDWQATPPTPE